MAPVANVEKAFHVTMGLYQHPTQNRTFYAPDREPTVDLSIRLWHISGWTTIRSHARASSPGFDGACQCRKGFLSLEFILW